MMKFHITEFVSFYGAVGRYLIRIGRADDAERRYYEALKQVAPDDPHTLSLGRALMRHKGLTASALERFRKFIGR